MCLLDRPLLSSQSGVKLLRQRKYIGTTLVSILSVVESQPQDKQIVQKSLVTAMLCSSDAMRLDVYRSIQKVNREQRFCFVLFVALTRAQQKTNIT